MQGKLSAIRNLRLGLLLWAAAAWLSACTAAGPPKPASTVTSPYGNYRQVVRNGQTFFCRSEKVTGTLFTEENCLTQAQMQAQEENARRIAQDAQSIAVAPASPNAH